MGSRIQQRRKALKISQAKLAEAIDISNNHLSNIENGKENPSLEVFVNICIQLNVTPDYILLGSMHANNVDKNLCESLRLCSDDDIELISDIISMLIQRNHSKEKLF